MKYYIVRHDGDAYTRLDGTFDTTADANNEVRRLINTTGVRHSMRPIEDNDWTLKVPKATIPLPWGGPHQRWQYPWYNEVPNHFARVSDDGKVMYFENPVKGSQGIWTTTTAGRYLTEFFSKKLTQVQITNFATEFDSQYVPVEVFWATTPEDIEHVFRNLKGVYSCAQKADWKGPLPHPAQVYASPDIAIAYIKNAKGEITARANCFPEKKLIGGIYGDSIRLRNNLLRMGFIELAANDDRFNGHRLRKLIDPENKWLLGVHIDYFPRFRVEDEWLIIDNTSQYGFFSADPYATTTNPTKDNRLKVA